MNNSKMSNERWLGYGEAADYLGCSERQLKRWVSGDKVRNTKPGSRVLFTREYLDAFIEGNTRGPNYEDRAG